MWKELKDIALIGTERRQADLEKLPNELKSLFTNSVENDPETTFLEILSYYNLYLEAGKEALNYTGDFPEKLPDETNTQAPVELENLFKFIRETEFPLNKTLLDNWLDTLINNQLVINPANITELISYSASLPESVKQKTAVVIGNKGRSILKYMPEFSAGKIIPDEQLWNEGTTKERKALFEKLLNITPARALDFLQMTWKQESVTVKNTFLTLIKNNSNEVFLPFIEQCYHTEFNYSEKEKKTEKQNRQLCAEILLTYPQSVLCKQTIDLLKQYISLDTKKSFLSLSGNKLSVNFSLPVKSDEILWNDQIINSRYGFETVNYDFSIYPSEVLYWFGCFLSAIPLEIIAESIGTTIQKLINSLFNTLDFTRLEKNIRKPIFLQALLENGLKNKNPQLIALLTEYANTVQMQPLLEFMSEPDFEKYIQNNNLYSSVAQLKEGPYKRNNTCWSIDFSKHILFKIHEDFKAGKAYNYYSLGKDIASLIHPDILPYMTLLQNKLSDSGHLNVWNKHIQIPITQALSVRHVLNNYNNEK